MTREEAEAWVDRYAQLRQDAGKPGSINREFMIAQQMKKAKAMR